MALDKFFAQKHMWRISELTLFFIAAVGGSLGSWVGMYLFRHKTKHYKFVIGIPVIILCQAVFFFYFRKTYWPKSFPPRNFFLLLYDYF